MIRILVVDDDVDILQLMKYILTENNFEVGIISDWREIKLHVSSFKPDLIILDVHLNGSDGRGICRELKALQSTKEIPVIIYSAGISTHNHFECGAQAFIAKPFDIANLLSTIALFTKPIYIGNFKKESHLNMIKDLDAHFSELETANRHLLTCTTEADIENAHTWIRIINVEIAEISKENLLCSN